MLRTALNVSALLAILASSACSAAIQGPFTPPESGGAPWVEVTSAHFILRTDLPADDAREALEKCERIYSMFEDIAFPSDVKIPMRTRVVIFGREAEYEAIAPKRTSGFFRREVALDDYAEPIAVMHGELTESARLVFQHELAHRFVSFYYPKAPLWLNEGLAEYYSTMTVEDGKVVLGRQIPTSIIKKGLSWSFAHTPMWDIAYVPTAAVPQVKALLASERGDFSASTSETSSQSEQIQDSRRVGANYVGAWALVHMMKNGNERYRKPFESFMARLGEGKPGAVAWAQAFAGIEPSTIEGDFQASLAPVEVVLLKAPYEPSAAPVETGRALDPADVHLAWASVRQWGTEANRIRARADIEAALRLDPDSTEARLLKARLDEIEERPEDAEATLNEAVKLSPDDSECLYALFRLQVRRALNAPASKDRWQRADALLPRLLRNASSVQVQNGAARYLAYRGRADEGLRLALGAVKTDPGCFQCYDTLALLVAEKGALAKAVEVQQLAVDLMPDGVTIESVLDRLHQYEEAAKKAAAQKAEDAPPATTSPE